MSREYDRKLILEDGQEYYGYAFGDRADEVCEIVFNTSMVGYQEILSDPSYTYQAVVMTYPLMGNYGMAEEDYETDTPTLGALIAGEYNDEPSNFRSTATLSEVMIRYGIPGIHGIDTRKLTRSIRDLGSRKVLITGAGTPLQEGLQILRESQIPRDAVSKVSCGRMWEYPEAKRSLAEDIPDKVFGKDLDLETGTDAVPSGSIPPMTKKAYHVVAIDCGMKHNILRSLAQRGCRITVVPWNTTAAEIRSLDPDGIFLSNGPGDPTDVPETIETVRQLRGCYPIFGICLGHQILSLAYGASTYKLKFGHRGGNHPVRDLTTGRIEITSQNHSYAVEEVSLAQTPLVVTHRNLLDGTVEGVACQEDRAFSVQYHPESAPGPQDSTALFDRFIRMMEEEREHA